MKWFLNAAGVRERAPLLVADVAVWRNWRGTDEPQASFDALDGVVGVVDLDQRSVIAHSCEGGVFDIGVAKDEVVVLQHYASDESDSERDGLRQALAAREKQEYLAGEIAIREGGVLIGDSWQKGAELDLAKSGATPTNAAPLVFFAPLKAGRYLVLEGRSGDEETSWYRLRRGEASGYERRPEGQTEETSPAAEVAGIMGCVSFEDPIKEARALGDARELIRLRRPDLALGICNQASPARRVLASWVRVFALAALGQDATAELTHLAGEWLAPATTAEAANQLLPRQDLLGAIDAVDAAAQSKGLLAPLRARVADAPEPEVFVPFGDSF